MLVASKRSEAMPAAYVILVVETDLILIYKGSEDVPSTDLKAISFLSQTLRLLGDTWTTNGHNIAILSCEYPPNPKPNRDYRQIVDFGTSFRLTCAQSMER